uniref:Cilia- and flagella-associated protein 69 ARM repeats domain-containing protein n=1 Tax=Sinocyclocheilus grahami TaxID=75366 RepID=A0A672K662_SINGR
FILKKVVKQCHALVQLLRDLADICKIINVCAERVSDHPEYARILCDLLQICSLPFLKEKSSDEMSYACVTTGFLMRIPLPEVRRQICSTVIAFYSRDKHKHRSDGERRDPAVSIRASARSQCITAPSEPAVCFLTEVNCNLMLRAQGAQKICFHMSEGDPSGELLFRSSEILWNLLENGSRQEVTSQLSSSDCIASLKDVFLHLLLKGFRHHERQLRNDLLVLLSLIAEKPGAPLIESGFLKHLTPFLTFPELKSHNPLVRNLKLSFSQEDFEMKKLLLNMIVVLSRDLAVLQLFREGRVMLALMLLVKPSSSAERSRRHRHRWSSRQQEELQLQALSTLSALAPLMLDEYMSCQANTCLVLSLIETCLSDSFSGRSHGFHGSGGGRRAQLRYCVRVLRSVASVEHEPLLQDLCDQGAIGQLLGESPSDEDAVALEIQTDCLFLLSVLCEGDVHRKELFGTDGVEVLIQYLSLDAALVSSGLGHNKLLLSTVDCLWSCVLGCFGTEDVFVAGGGVDLLLQLLQRSPRHMLTPLVSVLLELCESPQAITRLLRWSGERDASAPQLLLHIWRREEEQTGVSRDPHGMITDVKRPIVSRHQDESSSSSSSSHDVSAAVRDVSENLRANIYCIFCKLGFERLSGLSAEDHVTLSIIHRYLDFKVSVCLCEVVQELWSEAAAVVPSDEAALKSVLQVSEAMAESVRSLQQSILGERQQQELQKEQRLYSEVKLPGGCTFCTRPQRPTDRCDCVPDPLHS